MKLEEIISEICGNIEYSAVVNICNEDCKEPVSGIIQREMSFMDENVEAPWQLISFVYMEKDIKQFLSYAFLNPELSVKVVADESGRIRICVEKGEETILYNGESILEDYDFLFDSVLKVIFEIYEKGPESVHKRIKDELRRFSNTDYFMSYMVTSHLMNYGLEETSEKFQIPKEGLKIIEEKYIRDFNERKIRLFNLVAQELADRLEKSEGRPRDLVEQIYLSLLKGDMNYIDRFVLNEKMFFGMCAN